MIALSSVLMPATTIRHVTQWGLSGILIVASLVINFFRRRAGLIGFGAFLVLLLAGLSPQTQLLTTDLLRLVGVNPSTPQNALSSHLTVGRRAGLFCFSPDNSGRSSSAQHTVLEGYENDNNGRPLALTSQSENHASEISLYPSLPKAASAEMTAEMQASLNLARNMSSQNKTDKALKIFLHILALHPHHPDVLNEYGEYLEQAKKDIVLAEHMYCRALIVAPSHTRAVANRKRTLPLVEEIDQTRFDEIDRKRDMLIHVPEGHPGLRRMVQESYFRHLYHTTAMEGNTFTLSQTRSFVETHIVIAGKSIMEHNEILGMEAAFNFLNSSLIKRIGAITSKDIMEIHRRVLGFVDPISSGIFRTTQVFVGEFVPPPASAIEALMSEFLEWLNSEDAASLHPIEAAALAHYKLVYIHPFYDGNGRTSRLLMNLVLMQTGYPPIVIPVEEKQNYYKHLQTANDGDVRPFIRFIASCAERTIEEFLWATIENPSGTVPELSLASARESWVSDRLSNSQSTIRLSADAET